MDVFIFCEYFAIVLFCLHGAVKSQNLTACLPNGETIICENNNCTLQCGPMGTIHIISASYGRTSNETVCPDKKVADVNCSALTAMQNVSEECEHKTSCVITASNDVFGEPCKGTFKYVNLTYTCKEIPKMAKPTSKITGIIVAVVVLFVIICICLFVLIYWRLKLQKKEPGLVMNSVNTANNRSRDDNKTRSNDNQSDRSVYHQYSEISPSTTKASTCADNSTCAPEYSYPRTVPGNNLDRQERDKQGGYSSNKLDLKCKDNGNDGAYFVLDPKETGIDRLNKSNVQTSNAEHYELAKCTVQTCGKNTYTVGQYGDLGEYNQVENTNPSQSKVEDLYDRVADGMYDVSSHGRSVTSDNTYDHFNEAR